MFRRTQDLVEEDRAREVQSFGCCRYDGDRLDATGTHTDSVGVVGNTDDIGHTEMADTHCLLDKGQTFVCQSQVGTSVALSVGKVRLCVFGFHVFHFRTDQCIDRCNDQEVPGVLVQGSVSVDTFLNAGGCSSCLLINFSDRCSIRAAVEGRVLEGETLEVTIDIMIPLN